MSATDKGVLLLVPPAVPQANPMNAAVKYIMQQPQLEMTNKCIRCVGSVRTACQQRQLQTLCEAKQFVLRAAHAGLQQP